MSIQREAMEVLLRPEVRRLLDQLSAALRVRTALFDAAGRPLLRGGDLNNSRYCELVQKRRGMEACREIDRKMQLEARKCRRVVHYRCPAGLTEAVAPVYASGEVAGFVMIGQFRTAASSPGADAPAAERRAFARLPELTPDEFAAWLGLFESLVDYIVARELVRVPGGRRSALVDRYLNEHLTEKITVNEVARAVGCSASTLTHYLRSNCGKSFKELLEAKRMEYAARLLRATPGPTIAEAAAASGFRDSFYFSRRFRKYFGMSPRTYQSGVGSG